MINLRYSQVHLLLFIVLIGFAALGLWIRLLPMDYILSLGQPVVLYEDPWYTVRQVEQILPNFPEYSWFDPMLSFPYGKVVDWGPVFPLFAALLALIAGASTQGEIILAINWAPVLLGLLMIPLTFLIGRLIWDSRAGWISAMLICVVGGETLFRSFYGDVDHHTMEVVLTSAFFVCYFYLLSGFYVGNSQKNQVSPTPYDPQSSTWSFGSFVFIKNEIFISILGGLLYFLAIMTMPTCTIIAITVAILTFLFPIFILEREALWRLLYMNGIIFSIFMVLYYLFGIHTTGWVLYQYNSLHLLIPLFIIIESCIIFLIANYFCNPKPLIFPAIFFMIFGIIFGAILLILPQLIDSYVSMFYAFFGFNVMGETISEMQFVNPLTMLKVFNITLFLALGGYLLLISGFIKGKNPLYLGTLVWVSVYLVISFFASRYFYYGGQNIVILSAICLSALYLRLQSYPIKKFHDNDKLVSSIFQNNKKGIICTGLILFAITCLSVQSSLAISSHDIPDFSVNDEWYGSLLWLKSHSHTPGIHYFDQYTKEDFKYSPNMTTVLAWWEEGHWILSISQRSPVATPFLDGTREVAKFFLSKTNLEAEKIAEWHNVNYVITTNDYIFTTFPQIQKWLEHVTADDPYYFTFYQQDSRNKNMFAPVLGMKPAFFNTTLVRLHVNDGSNVQASGSVVIQYKGSMIGGKDVALLQKMYPIDQAQTIQFLSQPRSNQEIISLIYTSPVTNILALQNYRLIYESNGTETFPGDVTLNNIKIFERVKGYTIPGTGTIEVPIVTNQGRHFTYRQQSENGTFTLPYATTNSPYEVRATGPYRIIETNKTIDVDESQIEKYYT